MANLTERRKSKSYKKKKADELFSLFIRTRDKKCLKCGKITTLQCAHIIGRRNHHLRFDPQNAVTLCYSDHLFWAHKEPLEFMDWLEAEYPQRVRYLRAERKKIEPIDYDEIIESLSSLLKKYE